MFARNEPARRGIQRAATALGVTALAVAGSVSAGTAARAATDADLLGISVQSYSTYDRVTLDVSSIPGYTITPTGELDGQGSGKPVTLPNSNTYLDVELSPADITGFSGPALITASGPEVEAVQLMSSGEGDVQIGIGLDHTSTYTVTALSATELAIDVAH